ncbi:UxaA family hydrolase [Roseomonas sp. OT10]|uniref:UxaA family hydrolase n=1 Tax=Roseomonas cutis TaxID=2897332 RepID=UPI001E59880A|nr:UxaA family hydrolase [Roseomonas sp. OT10]UFN48454.1 UxaA family hydrolase [Roseomonas sp. OT10]
MATFLGFRRADGQVGVRNHLLVLSTGGLTGRTARRVAAALAGAVVVVLPHSAGLVGRDLLLHRRAIAALATHPNVGACVLVGDNPVVMRQALSDIAPSGRPHVGLTLDDCGHDGLALTDRALRAGAGLARLISRDRRTAEPAAALGIGLECGRSDPSSGLVANPLLGLLADWLVDAGGWAVLGETLEWLGAEQLLAARARTADAAAAITGAVLERERIAVAAGLDLLGSNPGPTNIAAGLSTIEEKSLGNVAKSGSRPIEGLLGYGDAPPRRGLWTMDASAYAPKSLTGFVLSGAQVMLFTTGVGNPYASALSPTIKLSANPETCAALGEQLDYDASPAFIGRESLAEAALSLRRRLLDIASGEATWGEITREGDEVLSRFGQAL